MVEEGLKVVVEPCYSADLLKNDVKYINTRNSTVKSSLLPVW